MPTFFFSDLHALRIQFFVLFAVYARIRICTERTLQGADILLLYKHLSILLFLLLPYGTELCFARNGDRLYFFSLFGCRRWEFYGSVTRSQFLCGTRCAACVLPIYGVASLLNIARWGFLSPSCSRLNKGTLARAARNLPETLSGRQGGGRLFFRPLRGSTVRPARSLCRLLAVSLSFFLRLDFNHLPLFCIFNALMGKGVFLRYALTEPF